MKICLVGPGIMPIPPNGWGAVEILIWDYKEYLEKRGHQVYIINTKNKSQIIQEVENYKPDFVHIHYDEFIDVANFLVNKWKVAITSHYGYLNQPNHPSFQSYRIFFEQFFSTKAYIFALSDSIKKIYIKNGINDNQIFIIPNGVRTDLFKFQEKPDFNKSIYLAKIEHRKRQYLFQHIPNLYFVGNKVDNRFYNMEQYLGEWNKEYLYNNLTKYSNLVLLSDGEAHPLVCLEAMAAGLGLVISEFATANLDLSKPFIDVISEDKINDISYVSKVIENNRIKSVNMRFEIRNYVLTTFSYDIIIDKYIKIVESIILK